MDNLNQIMERHIENGSYPCLEWKVKINDSIEKGTAGFLNIDKKNKINHNSIYRIWSMTKPIISVAIAILEEKKIISFNDPINKFLPQFNNLTVLKKIDGDLNETEDLKIMPRIKDLLLHTSGFTYNFAINNLAKEYDKFKLFYSGDTTLEEEIDLLSKLPLLFQPGKKWHYSVSTDILGRIIEIAYKKSLRKALQELIFIPVGMTDTDFGISKDNINRLVESYEYDANEKKLTEIKYGNQKISNYSYPTDKHLTYARGGHGLFSSFEDYFLFADMLLTGKTQNGKKILSNSSLNNMVKNHIDKNLLPLEIKTFGNNLNSRNDLEPYGWGLGFRVMLDIDKNNKLGSSGEFGWSGAASTFFLVDKKNNLTALLMTQVFNSDMKARDDLFNYIYKKV